MARPVLLLLPILSIMAVQCGLCDGVNCAFLGSTVRRLNETINDPSRFREVFPIDYTILHHYNASLFCVTEPCCVFLRAAVLSHSWNQLLDKLYPENRVLRDVRDLKKALNDIKDKKLEDDDPELTIWPQISSSPEDLLRMTSVLFSSWLEMNLTCKSQKPKCPSPTEPTPTEAQQENPSPSRPRLLTTRDIHTSMRPRHGPPSAYNGGPLCLQFPGFLWTLLLCGLYSLQ